MREFPVVRIGEAVTLDILYNPSTGEKIFDVLRPITAPPSGMSVFSAPAQEAISLNDIAIRVNGRALSAPASFKTGSAIRIDIPRHGTYIVAAYDPNDASPNQVFAAIAQANGKTMSWAIGGDRVEIVSSTNILRRAAKGLLWVYHDPHYHPDVVGMQSADSVEGLLPGLRAADFWEIKPPAEWSRKELQRMITNSPSAQPFTMPWGGTAFGPATRLGGSPNLGQAGFIVARWESAAPIRQALMSLGSGTAAAFAVENSYVIVVSGSSFGFPPGRTPVELEADLMRTTSLAAKGKVPLKPTGVKVKSISGTGNIFFYFPRSAPFTLNDEVIEFSIKLGSLPLDYKFQLKDMVFEGKLEL